MVFRKKGQNASDGKGHYIIANTGSCYRSGRIFSGNESDVDFDRPAHRDALCAPFTIIFLFTTYLPGFCKKQAAFWTMLVGSLIIALWALLAELSNSPHAIYLEWLVTLPLFYCSLLNT